MVGGRYPIGRGFSEDRLRADGSKAADSGRVQLRDDVNQRPVGGLLLEVTLPRGGVSGVTIAWINRIVICKMREEVERRALFETGGSLFGYWGPTSEAENSDFTSLRKFWSLVDLFGGLALTSRRFLNLELER
jgi:hypothetical protein